LGTSIRVSAKCQGIFHVAECHSRPAAHLEAKLRRETTNIEADVKEAFCLGPLPHRETEPFRIVAHAGADRFETDGWLKGHKVLEGLPTMADLDADRRTLERVVGKAS